MEFTSGLSLETAGSGAILRWGKPCHGKTACDGGVLQGREEPRRGAGTWYNDVVERAGDPQLGLACDGDDNIKGGTNDPENTRRLLRRGYFTKVYK